MTRYTKYRKFGILAELAKADIPTAKAILQEHAIGIEELKMWADQCSAEGVNGLKVKNTIRRRVLA